VVPYSYESYRRLLLKLLSRLGLSAIGWSPHSPRSGFASESISAGESFIDVREAGRWLADSSLRTYIDLARSSQIASDLALSGLQPALDYCSLHIADFFPAAQPFLTEHYGSQGVGQGHRRSFVPTVTDVGGHSDPPVGHAPADFRGIARQRGRGRGPK
jgi:hypothetical protein